VRSPTLGYIPKLSEQFKKEFSMEMFYRGNFTRLFELKVKEAYNCKLISIPIYLSIGTEFNSAALSMVLKGYNLFGQHRCHGLYLAFGGRPEALRDELLGLQTGCAGGMSGSNAIHAPEINMFGHSGLMGEQIPIAVGMAYGSDKPSLAICGDASVEEDYIYPSLGWAASKKIPVLFVCEDNDLSILTKVSVRRTWSPVAVAKSMGIPAVDIADDPWLLAHHAQAMSNDLPAFINVRTVRHMWHAGTGTDGPPEWNRYEMTIEQLKSMGLGTEIERIDGENSKAVDSLWEKQLQIP
jgi:pyruvate dehydrogenase E1 component alpha subunit